MNGECCMFACHRPVAETLVVPTVLDDETVPIAYPLCQQCADQSHQAAQRGAA